LNSTQTHFIHTFQFPILITYKKDGGKTPPLIHFIQRRVADSSGGGGARGGGEAQYRDGADVRVMGWTTGDGHGDGAAKKKGSDDKWYQRNAWKARIEEN